MADRPVLRSRPPAPAAVEVIPATGGDYLGDLILEADILRVAIGFMRWADLAPFCEGADPKTIDRSGLIQLISRLNKLRVIKAMRIEFWVNEHDQPLVGRVNEVLQSIPREYGSLQGIAVTGKGDFRNFVAFVHEDMGRELVEKLQSVEGLWINEYPPGIDARIKDGSIWRTDDPQ